MNFNRIAITVLVTMCLGAPAYAAKHSTHARKTVAHAVKAQKININQASAEDLMQVDGISANKARAIVAYRKKHGDFKKLEELASVKGFKRMKPEKISILSDRLIAV